MPASKMKTHLSQPYGLSVLTPFLDFDHCHICSAYATPMVWIKVNGTLKFVCEECYEKIKKAG